MKHYFISELYFIYSYNTQICRKCQVDFLRSPFHYQQLKAKFYQGFDPKNPAEGYVETYL